MLLENKEMKTNQIIHGNCLEEIKKMPDNSVDLIFADPPYWMRIDVKNKLKRPEGNHFSGCDDEWDNNFETTQDYEDFTYQWLKECYRILSKNGSIWVIGGMQCIYTIGGVMQKLGFWFINDVIWHKTNPTPNFMGTRLNNSHETLIWATKNEKSKFTFHYKTAKELNKDNVETNNFEKGVRKQMGSIWKFSVCNGNERLKNNKGEKLHNTQKPEDLLYRIIALTSNEGDLVFDPFGGTMTTATVAKKLKRNFLTIEQNEEYIKYGQERINKTIIDENLDIIQAKFDKKPLKVSMEEMIKENYFLINEKFYLKNTNEFALLTSKGKLIYNNEIFDMHSLAAKLKKTKANRLNGFNFWEVERNGKKNRN